MEKDDIDGSTHVHIYTDAQENAMSGLALRANIWHDVSDASTQTSDVAVSKSHDTSISKSSPAGKEALVGNTPSDSSPALERRIDDTWIRGAIDTQGATIHSDTVSEVTLVDSPSESLSRSLPQPEYGEDSTATAESSAIQQADLLGAEEATHWETREELSRLDGWCSHSEDENTQFQVRIEKLERENARMQRQLNDADDESTASQTKLSDAQGRIQELMDSIRVYVAVVQGLNAQVVGLNADISSYVQLGTDLYTRLQNAEAFVNPHDRIFAEYRPLMNDAERYFRVPTNGADQNPGNGSGDVVRIQELDEIDDNEQDASGNEHDQDNDQENGQESDRKNDGAPTLGDGKVTCDNVPDHSYNSSSINRSSCSKSSPVSRFSGVEPAASPSNPAFLPHDNPFTPAVKPVTSPAFKTKSGPQTSYLTAEHRAILLHNARNGSADRYPITAREADAIQAEELEDDDTIFSRRPMRPGTANRVPISAFAATSGRAPRSPSTPPMDDNNSSSSIALDSVLPRATPPDQQTIYISPIPTPGIEEQPQSSVKTSDVTAQAGQGDDGSLNSAGIELTQSTNTETGLRKARAGKAKATHYAPDLPKWRKWRWAPFSPKPPKKVPAVWMPVSPTIRPSEITNRKDEASKRRSSGAAQEEAHVAKVKGIIASVAPRKKDKKAEQGPRRKETLPVEGPHSLMELLAQLSLGPSSLSVDGSGKKVKQPLSGDWNVSGLYNYTPNDLDRGPIFGRFLDSTTGDSIPAGGCKRKWSAAWSTPEWLYVQKRTRFWPERGGMSRAMRDWLEYIPHGPGRFPSDGEWTTGSVIRARGCKRKWSAVWKQPECLYEQKRTRHWPESRGGSRVAREWLEHTVYGIELWI